MSNPTALPTPYARYARAYAGATVCADPRRRDQLIQDHIVIVRDVVARLGGCLPDIMDFGDLAGHGLAALIEAAEDYAGPIAHFADFARTRITRRVQACVTGHVWYKTSARTSAASLRDLYADMCETTVPSDALLAATLGTDAAGLTERLSAVSAVMALEVREFLYPLGTEEAGLLGKTIANLPDLEQTVLALYFQEGLSLGEIAEVIGCDLAAARTIFGRAGLMLSATMLLAATRAGNATDVREGSPVPSPGAASVA